MPLPGRARQTQSRLATGQHLLDLLGTQKGPSGTPQQLPRLLTMRPHLAWIAVGADQGMQAHGAQIQYPNHLRPVATEVRLEPIEIRLILSLVKIELRDQGMMVSA